MYKYDNPKTPSTCTINDQNYGDLDEVLDHYSSLLGEGLLPFLTIVKSLVLLVDVRGWPSCRHRIYREDIVGLRQLIYHLAVCLISAGSTRPLRRLHSSLIAVPISACLLAGKVVFEQHCVFCDGMLLGLAQLHCSRCRQYVAHDLVGVPRGVSVG